MAHAPVTTVPMKKIVQEGTVGFRDGRPILEVVVLDEDIGYARIGKPAIPVDLSGKRVRLTIEEPEDAS